MNSQRLGPLRPFALVAAMGCAGSAPGSELLVPESIAVDWEGAYNEVGDGLGALVPLDVMVYDGTTGDPLPDAPVTLLVDADEAVTAVPVGAAEFSGAESGGPLWDSRHDRYLTLRPPSDTEGGTVVQLTTDRSGLVRWYLFVDAFPPGLRGGFEAIALSVSGASDETVLLTPQ